MGLASGIKLAYRRRTLLRYLRDGASLHSIGQSRVDGSNVMYFDSGGARYHVGNVFFDKPNPYFREGDNPSQGWGVTAAEKAKRISDTLNNYWKLKDNRL